MMPQNPNQPAQKPAAFPDVFGKGYTAPTQPGIGVKPQYPGVAAQPPATPPGMSPMELQVLQQMLGQAKGQ